MDVNPGRMIDLVHALEHVNLARKADFYYTARSLLVHDRDDLPLFEQAFALFWRAPREKILWEELFVNRPEEPDPQPIIAPPPLQEEEPIGGADENDDDEVQQIIEVTQTYSTREVLRRYIARRRVLSPDGRTGWSFAPMPGTSVLFETGPAAAQYVDDLRARGLQVEPAGDGANGFALYRIAL